jgi:hypothetical protein
VQLVPRAASWANIVAAGVGEGAQSVNTAANARAVVAALAVSAECDVQGDEALALAPLTM